MSRDARDATAARGVASFYADLHADPAALRVCRGTSCWLAGGDTVWRRRSQEGACRGAYCLGWCDRSPALLRPDGRVATGERAREGDAADAPDARPDVRSLAREPIVTARIARGSFAALDVARGDGAYAALARALAGPRESVLDAVERSGQRGRGGSAFPTAAKWRDCAATSAPSRVAIANGDEGDPGSFLDRVLMEDDPHALLEGLLLCAFAIGAQEGIVYIRSEYPRAQQRVRDAIAQARAANLAGPRILGSGFSCELSVVSGHGSYVCGEETALLNSIEGRRGEVRLRPPYPSERGLHGMPTVVNNVETLACVPAIVARGGAWYAARGTPACAGTIGLCLNAGFARPGIVEVDFGTPLSAVLADAGGAAGGGVLDAVLLGGPMGSVVLPRDFDAPVDYDAMSARGLRLGHGGLVALPRGADVRGLLLHGLAFMRDESCGRCAPCRLGSARAHALIATQPGAAPRDALLRLLDVMEQASLCGFGQLVPGPLRELATHFRAGVFGEGA
ncbi:MAG TPA: NADH-ubiquinone oxidoreductase-F iron-sulfur binding region domain-containing protein [Myxococcota bacterium]|nr:NADH-ubiquinone oxidoreductase-F iron-sulfur binding region domain-containing protein [Myxococcota bacterium]